MSDLFVKATRKKFRFPSVRGFITVEQLWELPLLNPETNFDLNTVAKAVNSELKEAAAEDFVGVGNPVTHELNDKLEVIKFIITVKQDDIRAADEAAAQRAKKTKILDAIDAAENRELSSLSAEELRKQLADL